MCYNVDTNKGREDEEMRTEKILIYEYEDMIALEEMSPKEASDVLEEAYGGYINSYIFPKEYEEYSVRDYYNYKIQCAFNIAYRVLEGRQNDK